MPPGFLLWRTQRSHSSSKSKGQGRVNRHNRDHPHLPKVVEDVCSDFHLKCPVSRPDLVEYRSTIIRCYYSLFSCLCSAVDRFELFTPVVHPNPRPNEPISKNARRRVNKTLTLERSWISC